jgi:hypothetical protein
MLSCFVFLWRHGVLPFVEKPFIHDQQGEVYAGKR